ncbi:uncharacterized protein LOC111308578 isoform X2 [Durio zibethinus]|uniref:Uncharacterized protein LOC111308578 isoform X2 n=1 Tax=Durio zibethinus TaxID=66656 RepID=A0A6P6AD91_DURZI|nr:uncharacterized protein LOC111308578 isoform X2 [Durio zibethinus]
MIGYGSYGGNGHGGGSSNLSALAPPFTVDRSIPKPAATPLVDLGEPLNWLDTNPYTFSSPQPAQLPQLDLDPITTPSYNQNVDLFEPKTYYPSYVSPPLHVPTFNEQSLSGLDHTAQWGGGLWDREKGKPAQLDGSFYSKETNMAPPSIYTDHINLGSLPSKSLKISEETSHNIYSLGREKQVGPTSIEKLDNNNVLGQNLSFMPVDYLKTSVIGSSSALPETNLQVPPLNLVNFKNNQVTFSTPYEKPVREHGSTPSDSIPAMKSSPGIVIRPSAGINGTDINLTGINPSNVKEPHYLNFGRKNKFDPSLLSFHLHGNCYLSGESFSTRTEKKSATNMASNDASDNLFREKSGVNFSHMNPNNFSLALDNNETVIAVENTLESLDHYNPPVDSPCWKGAPASNNSPFGSSETVAVQVVKKIEACDVSNGQALKFIPGHTANVVKLPSGKPGEILMTDENGDVEDGSVSSLKLSSVSIPSFIIHQPDDATKAGSYNKKTSPACEIKFSDDASERKKDYVLFNHSMNEVEKASFSIQQSLAEGRLASKNLHTSETGVADLEKINDVSAGCGSSNMSCHVVKDLSCSPSSVEDVSARYSKFFGKEPVSNSSISVLVDAMHNLSDLLLYHCCSEMCELKEQDLKSLEKVINNINTCMSKNIGQESFLSELPEGTSMGRAEVEAIDVLSQHVQEKRKHSGKKDEIYSDFVNSGTDLKVKNDKMTQAIKTVLIENFHEKEEAHPQVLLYKNLWLEAEAALCSINYMARFNNMKIEMEKCKLDSEKDLLEGTPNEDKISRPKLSAEVNTNKKLTAVAESGPTPAVSNQNSPVKSSSNHVDDVTARFHVLKHRLNNSNSVHSRDVDELCSSKVSLDLDEVDELATEVKDSSIPGLPSQDSPVLGTACHTVDVETSVMARFHILKNRGIDDLDSIEMERKQPPEVVDLGFAGKRKKIPIDKDAAENGISGVNVESVSLHQVANHDGQQLVVKDFHLCVVHDSTMQSPGGTRLDQLSAGCYDSCSSDWEHVLKEELSGQNS